MGAPLGQRLSISNDVLKVKTKVYCVDTKTLLGEFESRREAALFAGIGECHVSKYVQKKYINTKNKLGKRLAFR
jgi:hypothetical protein